MMMRDAGQVIVHKLDATAIEQRSIARNRYQHALPP
jgi:hypothetical protein